MKSREYYAKITDSISAILEAFILWIITTFCDKNMAIRFYVLTVIFIVIYIILFRNRLISALTESQPIDTNKLKEYSYWNAFHHTVLPIIDNIEKLEITNEFNVLYSFLLWDKAVETIIQYFWKDNKLCNVETICTVSISKNKVYINEIKIVAKKLLFIYWKNERAFSQIVDSYNCKTMSAEINHKLETIENMQRYSVPNKQKEQRK